MNYSEGRKQSKTLRSYHYIVGSHRALVKNTPLFKIKNPPSGLSLKNMFARYV